MKKAAFQKLVASYGATIDHANSDYAIHVDLPAGKTWVDNGCHVIVEPWRNNGGQSWVNEARAEVADRMSLGTTDCDNPECEICHPGNAADE